MKRRTFFKASSGAALAMALPQVVLAEEECLPGSEDLVSISGEISANHGHEVELSLVDLLKMFPLTAEGQLHSMSVQGRSGHPHHVELAQSDLVQLLETGMLNLTSTVDFGHSHKVDLVLNINETP